MDGTEKLAEAINRLAGAIESATAAAAGKGILDQTTGGRAGQPESAKPFGTSFAIKIKDQDQGSRSSLSSKERERIFDQKDQEIDSDSILDRKDQEIDSDSIDWSRAIPVARRLMKLLEVSRRPDSARDRLLLLQVSATAQVRLTTDWLDPVAKRVANAIRTGKVKTPLGYFYGALRRQLRKIPAGDGLPSEQEDQHDRAAAVRLREILDAVIPAEAIPAAVTTELMAGRAAVTTELMAGRAAVERVARKPLSEEEIHKLLAGMPAKMREGFERIDWSPDRRAG